MNTFVAKPAEVVRKWHLIDAEGKVLGRMAVKVSDILRGKNKPIFTPSVDTGDYVVVINAAKVKVTGAKDDQKVYYRHSQYAGSLKETLLKDMRERSPELIVSEAVRGMVPHTKLGRAMLKKLFVYSGAEHNQQAQNPQPLDI